MQTLTRTQNQVTNLSVHEERGFLLERTAAPHTCSGPPQSSAEQFGVETPHRIKLSPHVCGLQLKASPFRAGMEGKAYKLCVNIVVAAPKPERDAGQTTANMECPDRWRDL